MKIRGWLALAAVQMMALPGPVNAAGLQPSDMNSAPQIGTFAGARVRVPFGGKHEMARAGLAFTSTLRSGGRSELHFSTGAELGFSGDSGTVSLALGGRPASQLVSGPEGPGGRKLGVSTVGWIGIGIGVVAIATAGYLYWAINRCYECDD
jgi:hypothetical protein